MTAPSMTWAQVLACKPCVEQRDAARRRLRAKFPDIDTRAFTLADAAEAGIDLDSLIWIAMRSDERRARLFAADCAARVSHMATDLRPQAAIVAARRFARGEIGEKELEAARVAASAAAWDAERKWQRERLLAWFSDNEPEDWPITDTRKEIAA
ncbi:MAG: hypothetical protein KGL39_57580 [Patescibacteria group bacterium]|nr:hypothetical protein [Patescibacteria group bacterium]